MTSSRIARRHIWFRCPSRDGGRNGCHRYTIAGRGVTSDVPVPFLPSARAICDPPPPPFGLQAVREWPRRSILEGRLPLAGRDRRVVCALGPEAYFLEFEGAGCWAVAVDGSQILWLDPQQTVDEVFYEVLLGPCTCLALALDGTWCLHASAVTDGRDVAAFVGGSGRGKSTLARRFATGDLFPWRRCADDVLPVEAAAAGAVALPGFPQLKLADPAGHAAEAPERPLLRVVYLLEWAADARPAHVEQMAGAPAVASFVGHTHAARLFGQDLLGRHLASCGRLATQVPVRRLTFERNLDVLDAVARTVVEDLGRA